MSEQNYVWLRLFHGRNSADEQLDDWGFDGPTIGPLEYVHTTYGSDIKFAFATAEDHDRFFPRKKIGWNQEAGVEKRELFESSQHFTLNNDLIRIDALISAKFGLRVDLERLARTDGKTDARKD